MEGCVGNKERATDTGRSHKVELMGKGKCDFVKVLEWHCQVYCSKLLGSQGGVCLDGRKSPEVHASRNQGEICSPTVWSYHSSLYPAL